MEVNKINFDDVKAFSRRDKIYRNHPEEFRDFIAYMPNWEGFGQAIADRAEHKVDRKLLHSVITDHYTKCPASILQNTNISRLLDENCFTVVTAHQPSLLTGPLYYIYKIFSAINLAEDLSKQFPANHFVPVFISGSEDHDFQEVNHLHLFGKIFEWKKEAGGPVGRYDLQGFAEVVDEVKVLFGNSPFAEELSGLLSTAQEGANKYNDFVFNFVNLLFGKYGMLVLNMDDARLKHGFKQIMKKELTERPSEEIIKRCQEKWEKLGYSNQAHAREINLFYMVDGLRERILTTETGYGINNTDLTFSHEELLRLLDEHPEKFSPNVVTRPLYEETILPNLAYIGGGGELAYWLERKDQFEHFGVFFPILMRRDSLLWISTAQINALDKLNLHWRDLFMEEDNLVDKYIRHAASFDIALEEEGAAIEAIFISIKSKAFGADKSLESFVEAEKVKMIKVVEHIEQRIKRALKKNEETSVNQIKNLKSKLFPNNGLQERHDNFIQFYLSLGPSFMEKLKEVCHPMKTEFIVITNY